MSDFLFAHYLFASFFDLSAAYRHFTARLPAHSLIFLADTNAKMHFARNFFMLSATSTFESISSAAACALTRLAVQERFFIYLVSPLRHHNPISIQRTCSTQSLFNARTRCSSQLINVQTGLQSIQLGVNEEFKKGGGVGWVGVAGCFGCLMRERVRLRIFTRAQNPLQQFSIYHARHRDCAHHCDNRCDR